MKFDVVFNLSSICLYPLLHQRYYGQEELRVKKLLLFSNNYTIWILALFSHSYMTIFCI